MSTVGRGKVLKAGQIKRGRKAVPWEAPPRDEISPGEVELVKENGEVVNIVVRCRCGRVHELLLVDPNDANPKP